MIARESPLREALRLSWPATLALLLHSGYRVNDQYWIQNLGSDAQAALGLCGFMLIFNFAFVQIGNAGILARVAHHTGAGNRDQVLSACTSGVGACSLLLVVVGIIGYFATPDLVRMLGASGTVASYSQEYLSQIYICLPLIALKPIVDGIFIGIGNTMIPLLLAVVSVGLNFVLNPIMIFGWDALGVPAMGVSGAAWATGISRGVGGLIGLLMLRRHYQIKILAGRWAWTEVAKIARIGLPVAISTAAYAGCFIAVLKTSIEAFGSNVQAGLGIGFSGIEVLSYCSLFGPAMAVSGMVGRRLGAKDHPGAEEAVKICLRLSVGISLAFTAMFLAIPDLLAGIYTSIPAVRHEVVVYLTIVAWSQIPTAIEAVLARALTGAGRTLGTSIISAGGYLSRIPLALFLGHSIGLGPVGVWWALNISNYLKLAAIVPLYRREMRILAALHAAPSNSATSPSN